MDDYTFALYFIAIVMVGVVFLIWIGFQVWKTKQILKMESVDQKLVEEWCVQQRELLEKQEKILNEISKLSSYFDQGRK